MKTKKNIIIIAVISIIAVSVGVVLAFPRSRPPEVTQPTPRQPIPSPIIESPHQESLNIKLVITQDNIVLPEKAIIYSLSKQDIKLEEADSIAENLGFIEKSTLLVDPRLGNIMLWSNSDSLRITPSQGKIDYKTGIEPSGKFVTKPNQETLIKTAENFIVKNRLVNGDNLQFSSFNIRENEIENYNQRSESSQVAVVMFRETIDKFPIINTTTEIGTISVVFNANSEMVRVFIDRISSTTPVGEYPVKTFQEFNNSLSQAKILSLDNGKINLSETPQGSLTEIFIDKVSLGYLQENSLDQKFLQPVFVLTGSALLKNSTSVTITLYLPALAPTVFTSP